MKPKAPKISGLDLVLQAIHDAEGWKENGQQETRSYRTTPNAMSKPPMPGRIYYLRMPVPRPRPPDPPTPPPPAPLVPPGLQLPS